MAIILHSSNLNINSYYYNLNSIINYYLENDNLNNIFIIIPTGKWQRKLNNKIIFDYFEKFKKPLKKLNIFSPSQFINFFFNKFFSLNNYFVISDWYKFLIIEEIINNTELNFYKFQKDLLSLSLIKRLTDTINGIREDGLTSKDISDDLSIIDNQLIFDYQRLKEINIILKEYEEYLLQKNLFDNTRQITCIIQELDYLSKYSPEIISQKLFNNKEILLLFYGFTDFKKPEIELISKFGLSNLKVLINFDFSEINGPLCGNIQDTIRWLLETNKFKKFDTESNYDKLEPKNLEVDIFLRKYLFNNKNEIKYNFENFTKIYELPNKNMEVRFISKYIKKLIIEENFRPNEIAIVSRKPDEYANLFRQYLSIEKIPYNISERFLLKSSPIVIFVLDILDLILNNYHRDKFINILQNKLFDFKNSYLNIDKYNLIECLKNFKTLRNDWIKIFEKKIENLKILKQNDKYLNEDNLEIYNIDREIQNYKVALEDLKKFYNLLPKIDTKINWNIDKFYNLVKEDIINKFEIKEKIEQFYINLINYYRNKYYNTSLDFYLELEEIEKLSAAFVALISLLDELKYIYNKHNQNQRYSLAELINRLKLAVINQKYNIKERLNYGVEITSIEQIRGLDYKVIILCGANEGIFPIPFKTDIFLGKDIPDSKQRHYRAEQILFYQLMSHNLHFENKRTIITFFANDEGNEVSKSHFLNHLLNITNLQIINYNFNDDFLNLNKLFNIIEFRKNNHLKESTANNINHKISNLVKLQVIDNLKDEFEKIVLKDKSVSEFDTYSECSYKYLVSKFYKLYEFNDLDYEFSPLEIGNLLHKIIFIFYNTLKESTDNKIILNNNFELRPIKLLENNFDKYLEILFKIAHEILVQTKDVNQFFDIFYYEIIGIEYQENLPNIDNFKNNGLLYKWLSKEIENAKNNLTFFPSLFEFSFGLGNQIKSLNIENYFNLKGKIDRIDIYEDKENQVIYFLIIDYKLKINKDKHSSTAIKNLKSFQMPLYLYATKSILENESIYDLNFEYGGAAYQSLREIETNNRKYVILNNNLKNKFTDLGRIKILDNTSIENSISAANDIINKIKDGNFNLLNKRDKPCSYCNYFSICRVDSLNT